MNTVPVPCLWPGETIVCLAPGPSLTTADVAYASARAHVLAINDAIRLAPHADALYAAERKWWGWNPRLASAPPPPLKFTLAVTHLRHVHRVTCTGLHGLEADPRGIRSGGHSGYGAVNLAAHLIGTGRILLLGYDHMPGPGGVHHFFGDHPDGTHLAYQARASVWHTLIPLLHARGLRVFNVTRRTALPAVPRLGLEDALP